MFGIGKGVFVSANRSFISPFGALNSKKSLQRFSISERLFLKYKSLVDIRKECLEYFYPEKDVFVKRTF